MQTVRAVDASRHFSYVLKQVSRGEEFVVVSRGKPVATILPIRKADNLRVANDSARTAFQSAFYLTVDHGLQIWDAVFLAVTAENRCRMLLSEDMQHGFTWRGVTVVNPCQFPSHPLLSSILI